MTLRISLVLSLILFVFGFINAQDVQWLKSINGLADDEGFGMTVNESGNPVCCGYFNSDTIFFGSMFLNNHSEQANAADAFVIKYDLNGNPLWADNPGSSGHEKAWNVASDSENNIYLTGGFEGSFYFGSSSLESENLMDGMLLKYDASGNELWGVEISSLGQVEPRWIECDTEGNIIVSGRFYNHPMNIEDTTIANHNSLDIFMLKFNGEGELLWARSYGGYDDDYVMGMCTDLADNIYFTGGFHSSSFTLGNFQFSSSSSVRAAVIAQLDPDGDVIWAECHDDSYDQQFMGIDVDSSFNIYTSGYFKDLFNFGPYAIYANYGGFDVFLAKYNSNHEHQWIQKISSSAYERTDKLIVDNQGNVIIEVQTYGLLQIGDTTLPHNGGYDIVLAKFEPDGSLFWALHANGNADERAIEMAIGPFENFYTTGYFRSNQLAIGQEQINNKGMADAFISSIGPDCLPPYPAFNFVIDTLSVQFTSIGSADNYLWDFGDGDTSSLINPTHEYDTAGIYNVCLTVSNICGQEISCQDVTICIAPEAEFVAYAVDLEVSFYQLSQLAVDYYWDFGDGSYSTEAEPVHIYPAHDIYIATLTVINECGSDIHIDTLILAPPMMCNFSFVVENGMVVFTDESFYANTCYWEFGDGNTSTQPNPEHQYNEYGTYQCCLTIENDEGVFTFCDSVFYCEKAISDFEILINDSQVSLTDLSDKADSWIWDFGDGTTSIQEEPIHVYESSGDYTICQYSSNACSDDVFCKDISIEIKTPDLSIIVSTPSSPENLEIKIPSDGIYTSNIYTTHGSLIFNEEVNKEAGETYQIDISSLPSGIYILDIRSQSIRETLKFRITRL